MERKIAIAIDGPAAAGKSTVAKIVAKKLSYIYIDTGAMYRALTSSAIDHDIEVNNEQELAKLLNRITIELKQNLTGKQQVLVNKEDVTAQIRSEKVTNLVSQVAKHSSIRQEMVTRQQILAQDRGVVMDGRDIGTHVLPDAEIKIFLVASVEERAKRRYEENIKKGFHTNLKQLKKEIEHRDMVDSKRKISPLIKAENAIEIDTTQLSIDNVVNVIIKNAQKVIQH